MTRLPLSRGCRLLNRSLPLGAFVLAAGCGADPGPSPSTAGTGQSAPQGAGEQAGRGGAGGTSGSAAGGASASSGASPIPPEGGSGGTPSAGGRAPNGPGGAPSQPARGGTGGSAGFGGASAGSASALGGAGGSPSTPSSAVWRCPPGVTGTPSLSGTPTRVASVPPRDEFNMQNGTFGIIEGPVWIGGALYVSEISYQPYDEKDPELRLARILEITPEDQTSVLVADSGSNGLAVNDAGDIVAGVHKDGSITRFALPSGAASPLVTQYLGARFNSPNDLALRSDGTLYFSDPTFQAPTTPPQSATRVYRVPPNGPAEPIPSAASPDAFDKPNGVTLSNAEDFLYVSASVGRRYPVLPDGSVGTGADFPALSNGDGIVSDCAGNLYVAQANQKTISVFTADGSAIGTITVNDTQAVTNLAFGGADHKTLYITSLGNDKGLFKLTLNLPGRPY